MAYVRNMWHHPKAARLTRWQRYYRGPEYHKKQALFIRRHGLHKVDVLRMRTGKSYCLSIMWDVDGFRPPWISNQRHRGSVRSTHKI